MAMSYHGTVLPFLLMLVSIHSLADVKLSKAQAYLKKNNSCYLAVGLSNPNVPLIADPEIAEEVFCVMDVLQGAGGIHEKSGCGLMMLDMNTGGLKKATFSQMMNPKTVDPAIVEGVACGKGGFEQLLETKFTSFYGPGPKVKAILHGGPQGFKVRAMVATAQSDEVRKKYDVAVAKMTEEAKLAEAETLKKKTEADLKVKDQQRKAADEIAKNPLTGQWESKCSPVAKGNDQVKMSGTMSATLSGFSQEISFYHGGCGRVNVAKVRIAGEALSYSRSGNLTTAQVKITKVEVGPYSDEVADDFVSKSLYGKLAWPNGKMQNISAKVAGRTMALKFDSSKEKSSIMSITQNLNLEDFLNFDGKDHVITWEKQ
jgi:hypothetical protein